MSRTAQVNVQRSTAYAQVKYFRPAARELERVFRATLLIHRVTTQSSLPATAQHRAHSV